MRFVSALLLSLSLFCFSAITHAQDLTMRYSPHVMQGLRPLGMGNAFIAQDGSDINALFYNPAAIADYEKKTRLEFLQIQGQVSDGTIGFVEDIFDLVDDLDSADSSVEEIQIFNDFVSNNAQGFHEVGLNLQAVNFRRKFIGGLGIGVSIFGENRTVIDIDSSPNSIDLEVLSQVGAQIGAGYSFADDLIEIGVAVKFIERHLIDDQITQNDLENSEDIGDFIDTDNYGFGVGVDVGIKSRLPIQNSKIIDFLDPVFAITYQDIGDTRFTGEVGEIPQSLSFGLAFHPKIGNLRSTVAFDYRDANRDGEFITKFYAGYELMWENISPILRSAGMRFGLNQGYWTAGLGVDARFLKVEAATWGREIGQFTRVGENRIWGLQISGGF